MNMGKKSSNFTWTTILISVVTFIVLVILFIRYGEKVFPPSVPKKVETRVINLYFSNGDGLTLGTEERKIPKGTLQSEVVEAVKGLIAGPKGRLISNIPHGTKLLGVNIKNGVAFLDFSSGIAEKHPGGSSGELQTIYSIVNTVILNFPDIKTVQILIEGKRKRTLAGHIEIDFPLGPNKKIELNP
jgi:spore germination protein GerM